MTHRYSKAQTASRRRKNSRAFTMAAEILLAVVLIPLAFVNGAGFCDGVLQAVEIYPDIDVPVGAWAKAKNLVTQPLIGLDASLKNIDKSLAFTSEFIVTKVCNSRGLTRKQCREIHTLYVDASVLGRAAGGLLTGFVFAVEADITAMFQHPHRLPAKPSIHPHSPQQIITLLTSDRK